jgi:hypothetical protein
MNGFRARRQLHSIARSDYDGPSDGAGLIAGAVLLLCLGALLLLVMGLLL